MRSSFFVTTRESFIGKYHVSQHRLGTRALPFRQTIVLIDVKFKWGWIWCDYRGQSVTNCRSSAWLPVAASWPRSFWLDRSPVQYSAFLPNFDRLPKSTHTQFKKKTAKMQTHPSFLRWAVSREAPGLLFTAQYVLLFSSAKFQSMNIVDNTVSCWFIQVVMPTKSRCS